MRSSVFLFVCGFFLSDVSLVILRSYATVQGALLTSFCVKWMWFLMVLSPHFISSFHSISWRVFFLRVLKYFSVYRQNFWSILSLLAWVLHNNLLGMRRMFVFNRLLNFAYNILFTFIDAILFALISILRKGLNTRKLLLLIEEKQTPYLPTLHWYWVWHF